MVMGLRSRERLLVVDIVDMERLAAQLSVKISEDTEIRHKKQWFSVTQPSSYMAFWFTFILTVWIVFRVGLAAISASIASMGPVLLIFVLSIVFILDGALSLRGRPLFGGLHRLFKKYEQTRKYIRAYNFSELVTGLVLLLISIGLTLFPMVMND